MVSNKKCPVCSSSRFKVYNGIAICKKCNYQNRVFKYVELKNEL